MRMRPACARIPLAAIAIDLRKSITTRHLHPLRNSALECDGFS
jgi:hypothetical protein